MKVFKVRDSKGSTFCCTEKDFNAINQKTSTPTLEKLEEISKASMDAEALQLANDCEAEKLAKIAANNNA